MEGYFPVESPAQSAVYLDGLPSHRLEVYPSELHPSSTAVLASTYIADSAPHIVNKGTSCHTLSSF